MKPVQRRRQSGPDRRGASLVELVVAMAISGIVLAGIQGAIGISLRSIPSSTGQAATTLVASKIVDQLATDLESALFITQHTATTIGFTVPDRNGDGVNERILYTWSGTAGGPLTRQYNGGTAVTLISSVNQFSLTPAYKTVSDPYPSVGVEDAAESLLIDYSGGLLNLGSVNVSASSSRGQYFPLTLPANAYAWRPTRVQFAAKRNSSPASTLVKLCTTTSGQIPGSTSLGQFTIADSALSWLLYSWESFNFSGLTPLASGGSVCLVLQCQSGNNSATIMTQSIDAGSLQTNGSGVWQYNTNSALVSQLYGKLTRSTGSQYVYNNYLTAIGVSLQVAPTSPLYQKTLPCFNHPQLLSGFWELKFGQNPTTQDLNGDGAGDWVTHDGSAFNMGTIANGVWSTSGTQLDTSPAANFATTTVVDLRFQNSTAAGSGATFSINALRSGSTCAPILAALALQADGTQTLTVSGKTSDAVVNNLIQITGLPSQAIDLHLIIDPVTTAVSVRVNGVNYGTYGVTRFVSSDSSKTASLTSNGSTAQFSYARVYVLEQ